MQHSKQYERNCFITLTFNEENLQGRKTVRTKDWQDFAKRLRKKHKVEYFHSTEYGEKRSRPHHHAILFNYFPEDAKPHKVVNGNQYYTSEYLSKRWLNQGFIIVGELTYKSAAYTASYTFKKQRGKEYPEGISPEKMTCSHKLGIKHFLKHYKEYLALGHIIFNGKRHRIPRKYLKELEITPLERDLILNHRLSLLPHIQERYDDLMNLKQTRQLNAREDSILDRHAKYQFLIVNQLKYKKNLYQDAALSEDNRFLKQLKSLELTIMELSGEYNPDKKEKIYESVRNL